MSTSVTVVGVLTANANQARSARRRPSLLQPVHQFLSLSETLSALVAIPELLVFVLLPTEVARLVARTFWTAPPARVVTSGFVKFSALITLCYEPSPISTGGVRLSPEARP